MEGISGRIADCRVCDLALGGIRPLAFLDMEGKGNSLQTEALELKSPVWR